jgi:hypothetical protein
MTKLEEVARAIAWAMDGDPDNEVMDGVLYWQEFVGEVRAAIEALMEPSEAMYVAYIENTENTGIVPAEGKAILAAAKSDWQAMLKAAMEEDK